MTEHSPIGSDPVQPQAKGGPRVPPSIPDHELLRCIGQGGYGEVWLARNAVGTLRAVKLVYRDAFAEARPYEREFEGIQKFEPLSRTHEGLVDVLQIGLNEPAGCFYYVMELADPAEDEGEKGGEGAGENRPLSPSLPFSPAISAYSPRTLASDLKFQGRLPFKDCLRLGISLAEALEHLHGHGLIHRDIKPSNIIFVGGAPKLADIGLVTEQGEDKSRVGTEGFIPPEGPGTPQADVFSLGKVFYEISTGKDRQRFPEPLTALADLPDHADWLEFNEVVEKACESDPKLRYASASALRQELELLHVGQSVRQHRALQRQVARFKKWGAWTAAAALALVGGMLVFQWKSVGEARAVRRELLLREVQMARQGARTNGWFDACWEKLLEVSRLKPGVDDVRAQAAACLSGLDAKLVAFTNAGSFHLAFSPDGHTLLCAGVTDRTGTNAARLWHMPAGPKSRSSHSIVAEDQSLLTSVATNHWLTSQALPVLGDAVAAWKPDSTTNGTPVFFQPGESNQFVLRDALTGRVLQYFQFVGHPWHGNENHPVLAISPDARLAAASVVLPHLAGRFTVWDTATGSPLFQTNEPASALAFSPDGRSLAVGDDEGRMRVFSVPDFTLLAEFPRTRVRVNCFAFARDPIVPRTSPLTNAWWLAVGDAGGTIRTFRTLTREQLSDCRGSAFDVLAIGFSSDATLLASAGRHAMHLWDPATESELLRVPYFRGTRPDFIRSLILSPDGTWLVIAGDGSGSYPGSISLWQFTTKRGLQTLRGLASPVAHVWFSPDQSRIAALAHDWRLAVWQQSGSRLMRIIDVPRRGTADNVSLAFHPDGVRFAFSAGAEVILLDSTSGEVVTRWTNFPTADTVQLAFDERYRLLAVRNERVHGTELLARWRVRHLSRDGTSTTLAQQEEPLNWQAYGFALTPDARFFAAWNSIPGDRVGQWQLRLIETLTGRELQRDEHQHRGNTIPVMDASGRYLAFPTGDSQAVVRTIPDWALVSTWSGTPTIAPDGKTLAGKTSYGVCVTIGHSADTESVPLGMSEPALVSGGPVFSPNGNLIAWGDERGSVRLVEWRAVESHLSELKSRRRQVLSSAK